MTLHPALLLLVGGCVVTLLKGHLRNLVALAVPIGSAFALFALRGEPDTTWSFMGQDLILIRCDALAFVWAFVFHIAAFLGVLYGMHVKDRLQLGSALMYGGAAVGAVLAGDLLTLFLFWEVVAVTSTFQILARGTAASRGSAFRYLMINMVSGLFLLIGAVLQQAGKGDLAFGIMDLVESPGAWAIFLAFGVKCGWPLLHGWIIDGYPNATPSGTVFLSAFTTKLAVYALARGFAGTDALLWIGAAMAVLPLIYTVFENDLRRILCYSMMNQIGFMVVGVGIGTPLALNGVAAHAFCHILYKGLLFMAIGAVMYRTGRTGAAALGGLHRTMPWTTLFCCIGVLSISAFPLTSGFISKSMIVSAAAYDHLSLIWLILTFAAAAALPFADLRVAIDAFFGKDSGLRPKEAPRHMLVAMGLASLLCLGLGCAPGLLYGILPNGPESLPGEHAYKPYTVSHVITHLQLWLFGALAFLILRRARMLPRPIPGRGLDVDVAYRAAGLGILRFVGGPLMAFFAWLGGWVHTRIPETLTTFSRNPPGAMRLMADRIALAWAGLARDDVAFEARHAKLQADRVRFRRAKAGSAWPIGTTVLYFSLAFVVYLVLYLWK